MTYNRRTLFALFDRIEHNWGGIQPPSFYGSPAQAFYTQAKIATAAVRNGKTALARTRFNRLIAIAYPRGEVIFDDTTGTLNEFLSRLQVEAA